MNKPALNILALIPARFASTRFPGKPLVEIDGKTMIQRTYEQVRAANCWSDVLIATDDDRIRVHAESFGAQVMMTDPHHISGTDRCAEVVARYDKPLDYVVNIQGDEPFIDPRQLVEICEAFVSNPEIVTLVKKITDERTLFNPNSPKVVMDENGHALYFSRQAIPFLRNYPSSEWLSKGTFYKHIGLYAYRADVLPLLAQLKPSTLELAESLEQLRWLANGYQIKAVETQFETIGVDSPEDLELLKIKGFIS